MTTHHDELPITTILTQYPQPFINNFEILKENYGRFENIIRDMLVYLAHRQQTDLFGYIEFDMNEFCDTMSYNTSSMRRNYKTSKKNDVVISTVHNGYNWDSYIEFALLYMLRVNCVITTKVDNKIVYDAYQLLSRLEIDTSSKRKIFRVKLGHYITNSFFKKYINIELNDYVQIQQIQTRTRGNSALNNLYLYLMQFYSEFLRNPDRSVINLTVDDISNVINIPISEDNHRKRKFTIKSYLEKLIGLRNIFFNFSFEKFGCSSRFPYVIAITFYENKELSSDNKYHKFRVTILNKYENLYKKLNNIVTVSDSAIADDFINWFYDPDKNAEEKQLAQLDSIFIIFELLKNNENATTERLLDFVKKYYYEKNLSTIYILLNEYERKLIKTRPRISKEDFGYLIVKNDFEEIKKLIEEENYTYHLNPIYIQTAYMHGNYALVKYFAEHGAGVTKPLLDMIQLTKTKHSKELYNYLMKLKNNIPFVGESSSPS